MAAKKQSNKTNVHIKQISELANLNLTKSEESVLSGQMDETVTYISVLQRLDTSGISETARVTESENVFRDDVIDTSRIFTQDEALANAKRSHDGFFVADRVLEDKS